MYSLKLAGDILAAFHGKSAHRAALSAALAYAECAQRNCFVLFRIHREKRRLSKAGALAALRELEVLGRRSGETCSPLLSDLAALHKGQLVDGWDGMYPCACEALFSFGARVMTELLRFIRRDVSSLAFRTPFFELSPPKADHFAALLHAEFSLIDRHADQGRQAAGLIIAPGVIKYGDASVDLSGKPLACISAFLDAHDNRLDWRKLRERVWGEDAYTDKSTIKNTITDARDALRNLARLAGKRIDKDFDTLPCVERGKDQAWKLNFPE
jgi:hypothetical protein